MSCEEMQSKQEDKDYIRDAIVAELKVQWFNYSVSKRVVFIKTYPEIATGLLSLVEQK